MKLTDIVKGRLHPSSIEGVFIQELPLSKIIDWQKKELELTKKAEEANKDNDTEKAKELDEIGEKIMFQMISESLRDADGVKFEDLKTPKDLAKFSIPMLQDIGKEIRALYEVIEEEENADGKKDEESQEPGKIALSSKSIHSS